MVGGFGPVEEVNSDGIGGTDYSLTPQTFAHQIINQVFQEENLREKFFNAQNIIRKPVGIKGCFAKSQSSKEEHFWITIPRKIMFSPTNMNDGEMILEPNEDSSWEPFSILSYGYSVRLNGFDGEDKIHRYGGKRIILNDFYIGKEAIIQELSKTQRYSSHAQSIEDGNLKIELDKSEKHEMGTWQRTLAHSILSKCDNIFNDIGLEKRIGKPFDCMQQRIPNTIRYK